MQPKVAASGTSPLSALKDARFACSPPNISSAEDVCPLHQGFGLSRLGVLRRYFP